MVPYSFSVTVHNLLIQGHHFKIASNPAGKYTKMIPVGLNPDGVMTYKMTGRFAEVFDNLQVCHKI